jgi:hypothetical protein
MKKLMLATAIVLGTVAFTGCGDKTDGTNSESNGAPTEMGTDADSTTTPYTDTSSTSQDSVQ